MNLLSYWSFLKKLIFFRRKNKLKNIFSLAVLFSEILTSGKVLCLLFLWSLLSWEWCWWVLLVQEWCWLVLVFQGWWWWVILFQVIESSWGLLLMKALFLQLLLSMLLRLLFQFSPVKINYIYFVQNTFLRRKGRRGCVRVGVVNIKYFLLEEQAFLLAGTIFLLLLLLLLIRVWFFLLFLHLLFLVLLLLLLFPELSVVKLCLLLWLCWSMLFLRNCL